MRLLYVNVHSKLGHKRETQGSAAHHHRHHLHSIDRHLAFSFLVVS